MVGGDVDAGVQVGDGAGDTQNLVVSSSRQPHFIDALFHNVLARLVQWTVFAELPTRQVRVVDRTAFATTKTFGLCFASDNDLLAHVN